MRYVYEFSTTYKARRNSPEELRAVAFRAGVILRSAQQRRAVKIRLSNGSWAHGWAGVGAAPTLMIRKARSAHAFVVLNAAQLRALVKSGSLEVSYGLRSGA